MGQAPFQWAMPNGYPDRTEAWLPSLLGRWNFAAALGSGQISGTTAGLEELVQAAGANSPHQQAAALQTAILGCVKPGLSARLVSNFLGNGHSDGLAQAAALLLASPEFQWRE
jgi:hypothetical protein